MALSTEGVQQKWTKWIHVGNRSSSPLCGHSRSRECPKKKTKRGADKRYIEEGQKKRKREKERQREREREIQNETQRNRDKEEEEEAKRAWKNGGAKRSLWQTEPFWFKLLPKL